MSFRNYFFENILQSEQIVFLSKVFFLINILLEEVYEELFHTSLKQEVVIFPKESFSSNTTQQG